MEMVTGSHAIRDVPFSAAALGPTREASNVVPDSMSRPADIFLPTSPGGRPAALDVHIITLHLQQSTIHEAAFTPGHALLVHGNSTQARRPFTSMQISGVTFIPMVAAWAA